MNPQEPVVSEHPLKQSKRFQPHLIAVVMGLFAIVGTLALLNARAIGSYIVPASIKADCSVDVTAALNAWIASVPNNATLSFGANACYRIDDKLTISNRSNLIFEGNNATFKAVTEGITGRSHWVIARSTNITVRNVKVVGANPHAGTGDLAYRSALENQHGFQISGANGVRLESVTVTDVFGDFVYIGYNSTTGWSRNVTIINSHFDRNGRQGVGIAAADGVVIENNSFSQMRRATFDIEPNGNDWGVRNVRISHNTIGAGRLILLPITGGSKVSPISDIEFSYNTISGQDLQVYVNPPAGVRRSNIKILNNVSLSTWDCSTCSLITIRRTDGAVVQGNKQKVNPRNKLTVVSLGDSKDVKVTGNDFTGAGAVMKADSASLNFCQESNVPVVVTLIPTCTVTPPPSTTPPSTPPPTTPPPADPEPGEQADQGLTGTYFGDADLGTLIGSRTDPALDFTWRSRSVKAAEPNNFSVRWRGYITPSRTGWFTFYIRSDSPTRFWLASGKAYLSDWSEHRVREQSVRVYLERGKSYAVRLDFADTTGPATVQLLWSSAKITKEVIPNANLSIN